MEDFGWAIIGCGSIARTVAREMKKSGAGKIVAVWNRTQSRSRDFAARFGGTVCDSAEAALTMPGVNCAYIAVTHDKHEYFSALSVSLGVPVLCEKPAAVNATELIRVLEKSAEKKVYYAEAMWTAHNPVTQKVREWVHSGAIGRIERAYGSFCMPLVHPLCKQRLTSPRLAGGALLDVGIYPLRYAYDLFGYPKQIDCEGKVKGGIDLYERTRLSYDNFEVELFSAIDRFKPEKFVIEGSLGTITVPRFHAANKAVLSGKNKTVFRTDESLYGLELLHTISDVREGKTQSDYCPHSATYDVMRLLDTCRRALKVVYPFE